MRYAIDRFKVGFEVEVCADVFEDSYIPNKKTRFFCPECGETVFWRSKGGSRPNHFYHKRKSIHSPECEKRVDGYSDLYLYERIGLPTFIGCPSNGKFFLYMGFPSIGEKNLEAAELASAKVCISNRNNHQIIPIDKISFIHNSMTLIPIDFIPPECCNYNVRIDSLSPLQDLKKRWSDYAEGFNFGRAFFTCDETGGKKVRRGDSISPMREYYVVAKHLHPSYSEIEYKKVGTLLLKADEIYTVYLVTINISINDKNKFKAISDYLTRNFGVWLLEEPSELITLWPPMVTQDSQIPILSNATQIYCAVSSGNDVPNIYIYNGSKTERLTLNTNVNRNYLVRIPFYSMEAVISVDRKYIGREVFYQKKNIPFRDFSYVFEITGKKGDIIDLNSFTEKELSTAFKVTANARMDIFIGNDKHIYKAVKIDNKNIPLPSLKDLSPSKIYIVIENGVIFNFAENISSQKEFISEGQVIEMLKRGGHGIKINTPAWIAEILLKCKQKQYLFLFKYLYAEIVDGKIYLDTLLILLDIKHLI